MPEVSGKVAAEWAVNKLIKSMGEAKTLVIKLTSVKLSAMARGKVCNRTSWSVLPKHHHLQHALDEVLSCW